MRMLPLIACALPSMMCWAGMNNQLSFQERQDGYELLWNGLDYQGWRMNNNRFNPGKPGSNWIIVHEKGIESGDKHASADPDSNVLEVIAAGGSIFTEDSAFLNFDIKAEWRASSGSASNSGLFYFYQNSVTTDSYSARQFPLLNRYWTSEWKAPLNTAGTLYDMFPLLQSRHTSDNAPNWMDPGEGWNQIRIIAYGSRAAHFGNGVRLMEYDVNSKEWTAALSVSMFTRYSNFAAIHPGSFLLEDHGSNFGKFRNIRVKRLQNNPWGADSPYLNRKAAANGDSTLVDELPFTTDLFPPAVTTVRAPVTAGSATQTTGSGASRSFDLKGREKSAAHTPGFFFLK